MRCCSARAGDGVYAAAGERSTVYIIVRILGFFSVAIVLGSLLRFLTSDGRLSCVELYNEELFDLMVKRPTALSGPRPELKVFEADGVITVKNLTETSVYSYAEAIARLEECAERRRVAETGLNARSRHASVTVWIAVSDCLSTVARTAL